MLFRKEQILRETDTKRLIFNSNAVGDRKFAVYKKIIWNDKLHKWDTWELCDTFGTQGEANTYYEKMNDLPVERNYNEWFKTWMGSEVGEHYV